MSTVRGIVWKKCVSLSNSVGRCSVKTAKLSVDAVLMVNVVSSVPAKCMVMQEWAVGVMVSPEYTSIHASSKLWRASDWSAERADAVAAAAGRKTAFIDDSAYFSGVPSAWATQV